MATDNTSNPNATQAEMDDILSSIRTGMVEEGAKVGSGSADLIDAAAAQDNSDDDVLDLSEADIVGGEESEELIDLAAFGSSGEQNTVAPTDAAALAADILGEQAEIEDIATAAKAPEPAAAGGDASDEFDRLLAEISQEQKQQVVASEITKQALMDEEDMLGSEPAVDSASADVAEVADEAVAADEIVEDGLAEAVTSELVASAAAPGAGGGKSFTLGSVEGPEGVQIAFPAEVLAMALRPMVQEWLAKNLPSVVERLVKDEISKLTQN